MTAVYLAGVALAALLSENFILVNCLGIGHPVPRPLTIPWRRAAPARP